MLAKPVAQSLARLSNISSVATPADDGVDYVAIRAGEGVSNVPHLTGEGDGVPRVKMWACPAPATSTGLGVLLVPGHISRHATSDQHVPQITITPIRDEGRFVEYIPCLYMLLENVTIVIFEDVDDSFVVWVASHDEDGSVCAICAVLTSSHGGLPGDVPDLVCCSHQDTFRILTVPKEVKQFVTLPFEIIVILADTSQSQELGRRNGILALGRMGGWIQEEAVTIGRLVVYGCLES